VPGFVAKESGIRPPFAIDRVTVTQFENNHCRVLRACVVQPSAKLQGGVTCFEQKVC
jgi:hypothetical protein